MDSSFFVIFASAFLVILIYKFIIISTKIRLFRYLKEKYPDGDAWLALDKAGGMLFASAMLFVFFSQKLEVDEYAKSQVRKLKFLYILNFGAGLLLLAYIAWFYR